MRKLVSLTLLVIVLAGLAFSGAAAQSTGQASAKVTANVGKIMVVTPNNGDVWTTIMTNKIKTANMKDLFIDASLECGLFTRTLVRSTGGTKDTSSANASVKVQVLVDNKPALPGPVTFCSRTQTLSATLSGLFSTCVTDPNTGALTCDPEEIELILDTMDANSFNFILPDVPVGTHTIAVQARIDQGSSAQLGEADAKATIGYGSVTVESVRMIRGEEIDTVQ